MPKPQRGVLSVLFPEVRAKLLRLLFDSASKQHYVRELMRESGLALHTVQDELRKLTAVGLLNSWSNGYQRFYRANSNHALFKPLLCVVEVGAKLTKIKDSELRRKAGQRRRRAQRGQKRRLPVNRPINWGLFTPRRQTRRL